MSKRSRKSCTKMPWFTLVLAFFQTASKTISRRSLFLPPMDMSSIRMWSARTLVFIWEKEYLVLNFIFSPFSLTISIVGKMTIEGEMGFSESVGMERRRRYPWKSITPTSLKVTLLVNTVKKVACQIEKDFGWKESLPLFYWSSGGKMAQSLARSKKSELQVAIFSPQK